MIVVVIVWVMTTLQVIGEPGIAVLAGPIHWPFPSPTVAIFAFASLGCALQATSLLLSPRRPLFAVLAASAAYVGLLVGLDAPSWLTGTYLVIAFAQFLLSSDLSAASSAASFVASTVVAMGGLLAWGWHYTGDPAVAADFVVGQLPAFVAPTMGATALGIWWRAQATRATVAREAAELAHQQYELRLIEARDRERAWIAQELHDVAGQHLAGLVALSDAALSLVPLRSDQALGLVEQVRDEGRFAAASLAGALSDLRSSASTPRETTSDLRRAHELIDYWVQRGMAVTSHESGPLEDLPAVVSTTAYRALREALTNVAKHAPGSTVTVALIRAEETLRIDVVNGASSRGAAPVPGLDLQWGLTGIRERIERLSGSLASGPTTADGWEVRIMIPTMSTGAET